MAKCAGCERTHDGEWHDKHVCNWWISGDLVAGPIQDGQIVVCPTCQMVPEIMAWVRLAT